MIKIFGKDYDESDVKSIAKDVNERWENVKQWHDEDKERYDKTINGKNKELELFHKVLLELAHTPSHIISVNVLKALSSNGIEIAYNENKAFLRIKD